MLLYIDLFGYRIQNRSKNIRIYGKSPLSRPSSRYGQAGEAQKKQNI